MHFLVYMLTNMVNGKRYIGVTTYSLATRLREHHRCAAKGSKFPLYMAMRKYGTDAFKMELLYEACDKTEMMAVERGLISQYGSYRFGGYNCTLGGQGNRGLKFSDESRAKISAIVRGRKVMPAGIARMKAAQQASRAANPEKFFNLHSIKMRGRTRTQADRDAKAAAGRAYWESPEGQARKGKCAETFSRWRAENPDEAQRHAVDASKLGGEAFRKKMEERRGRNH